MTRLTLIYFAWFTPVFLFECLLGFVTLGLYILLTPSKRLLINKPNKWFFRKGIEFRADKDPLLKTNLINLGFYKK